MHRLASRKTSVQLNLTYRYTEWLKKIPEDKLTKENIKILAEEIYNHEPVLGKYFN